MHSGESGMVHCMVNQCPAMRTTLHTAYCEPCAGCNRERHHSTKAGLVRPICTWLHRPLVVLLFLRSRFFLAMLFLRSVGPASSLQQAECVHLRADQDWLYARAVRAQRNSGGRAWRGRDLYVKPCLQDSLNCKKGTCPYWSGGIDFVWFSGRVRTDQVRGWC